MKDVLAGFIISNFVMSAICLLIGTFTYPIFKIPADVKRRIMFIAYFVIYSLLFIMWAIFGILVYGVI